MKKFLLALAVLGTVSFAATSCNKNDDEENGGEATIVGTWETQDAQVTVKTSAGIETSLQDFLKTLGIPADAMEDGVEEDIPGRIEFTSDGDVVLYEKNDSGKWISVGTGTYTLQGKKLMIDINVVDEDGRPVVQSLDAEIKSLTSSKAKVRMDVTSIMQAMFFALGSEVGDGEDAAVLQAILKMFEGCSFYADITFKRV